MTAYCVIKCDGPDCGKLATVWPRMPGYRQSLRSSGWHYDEVHGKDYCPACIKAHQSLVFELFSQARGNGGRFRELLRERGLPVPDSVGALRGSAEERSDDPSKEN
jgi:hypothetical protein